MTQSQSETATLKAAIFTARANFDTTLRDKVFAPEFVDSFRDLLQQCCHNGAYLPRAEAAHRLGLNPALTVLTDKEEKALRIECENNFASSCRKHKIQVADTEHKFRVQAILDSTLLTEDQKAGFEKDCEADNFDAYDIYREARNDNLAWEALVGLVINESVIPGFTLQKGPGGGICQINTSRVANRTAKFPVGFLELAQRALDDLLPIRQVGQAAIYVKRANVTARMAAIWFEETRAQTGKGEVTWVGSEFEHHLSVALSTPEAGDIYLNFDSHRGNKKGVYRLAPGESKKEIEAKKKNSVMPAASVATQPPVSVPTPITSEPEDQDDVSEPDAADVSAVSLPPTGPRILTPTKTQDLQL